MPKGKKGTRMKFWSKTEANGYCEDCWYFRGVHRMKCLVNVWEGLGLKIPAHQYLRYHHICPWFITEK